MVQGEGVVALMILVAAAVLAIAFLAVLIPLFIWIGRRGARGAGRPSPTGAWPVHARQLMSTPEQVLYHRLVEALPGKFIFSQVQLTRILEVKNVPDRISWLNRLIRLSVDFVVCNPDTSVIAVIELDDASHGKSRRQDADLRKDEALAAAGIRIMRWHVNDLPSLETIRNQLGGAR